MPSAIVVHPDFDAVWPFAADHFHRLWQAQGPVEFVRLAAGDDRGLCQVLSNPGAVTRLVALHAPVSDGCLDQLGALREAVLHPPPAEGLVERIEAHGVSVYRHTSEGYWGQSVAEYGLALTLCGLRRIPQLHHQMLTDQSSWDYRPLAGHGQPSARGQQFGDDPRFVSGTIAGKRVRVVGAGNVGSRYTSFVRALGADVAAWDPYASEPCFHRAGARREWRLDHLVRDADIFAPMLPLTDSTRGLVTADLIGALPPGCLVVLVTRAPICDMAALRARVLAGELSLAADVFDREPLPLNDPLLGRSNVVHTPHNAGRTIDANHSWAEMLAARFQPAPAGPSPGGPAS